MWHYLKGVDNPKWMQTQEERKLKDQEYEKKRQRLFLDAWKNDRPWLWFDSESQAMFCYYCINAGVEPDWSSFLKGCTNFKLYAIKSQQSGNSHLYATNRFIHDKDPQDAPAERAKLSLNQSVSDKLMIVFHTIHAINVKPGLWKIMSS